MRGIGLRRRMRQANSDGYTAGYYGQEPNPPHTTRSDRDAAFVRWAYDRGYAEGKVLDDQRRRILDAFRPVKTVSG